MINGIQPRIASDASRKRLAYIDAPRSLAHLIPLLHRTPMSCAATGVRVWRRLRGDDVLGARAFRALADGERHAVAFAQGVERLTRARRLVKEILGTVRRDDETEAFVRDAFDRAVGGHL